MERSESSSSNGKGQNLDHTTWVDQKAEHRLTEEQYGALSCSVDFGCFCWSGCNFHKYC